MYEISAVEALDLGLTIHNPSSLIPFRFYKHSPRYQETQMWKPQADTRNPNGTTIKRWEVQGGFCTEARGVRSFHAQCRDCGTWYYEERDVSSYLYRGSGNVGPRGRWPERCNGCRERRKRERADAARKGMAKLRRDPSSRKRDFEFRSASRVQRLGSR